MSLTSQARSDEFLKISGQFKLGSLVTEASHPVTAKLSDVAKSDTAAALKLLFDVDEDASTESRLLDLSAGKPGGAPTVTVPRAKRIRK